MLNYLINIFFLITMVCCCLSTQPVEDKHGKIKTFKTSSKFQTSMCGAPCAGGACTCMWCMCQCFPLTCGITQFFLRRKVLDGDMSKYSCCQGQYKGCMCCCGKTFVCCEKTCPTCALCLEAHCCNFVAVSASRLHVMEKYNLSSDPCDYMLIQCTNLLSCIACACTVMAAVGFPGAKYGAVVIDVIAAIVYGVVSGCMTAQTAHEVNYHLKAVVPEGKLAATEMEAVPIEEAAGKGKGN